MTETPTPPPLSSDRAPDIEFATLAGGCFWCLEPPYDSLDGVLETVVGYTGGHTLRPDYESICTGTTGHAEAVRIAFDPKRLSYQALLDTFWRNIDPTALNRQFYDVGSQYRTAIFYHSPEQKKIAEESKAQLEASKRFDRPIVTEIVPAVEFFPAEDYHQDYYRKCPLRYEGYKQGSGRMAFLKKHWPDSGKS